MGNPITYPNGQTLTSTALTPQQIMALYQQLTCTMLGITSNLSNMGTLTENSDQVPVASVTGLSIGYMITDAAPLYGSGGYGTGGYGGPSHIPPGTVITNITGNILTISNLATGSGTVPVYCTNPAANTAVRQSWQEDSAPAWGIRDDVCFVRCTTEPNWYTTIRDEGVTQNEDGSVTRTREYTRAWRIFWSAYGPNCFDNLRAINSGLLLEVSTEPLAVSNLYVVPDMAPPLYVPELSDGQWWQRSTFEAQFYEQITEIITTQTIASVEIITVTDAGQVSAITVEQTAPLSGYGSGGYGQNGYGNT